MPLARTPKNTAVLFGQRGHLLPVLQGSGIEHRPGIGQRFQSALGYPRSLTDKKKGKIRIFPGYLHSSLEIAAAVLQHHEVHPNFLPNPNKLERCNFPNALGELLLGKIILYGDADGAWAVEFLLMAEEHRFSTHRDGPGALADLDRAHGRSLGLAQCFFCGLGNVGALVQGGPFGRYLHGEGHARGKAAVPTVRAREKLIDVQPR
jgi:hypothetical protein